MSGSAQKRNISLLGCTGSIGLQTLDVIKRLGLSLVSASAGKNVDMAESIAREYRPSFMAMSDESSARELKIRLADLDITVHGGAQAVAEAAAFPQSDLVINAVVGIAGLAPALAAIDAKKPLALANKECLVAGGSLVIAAARAGGVDIIPVDSEHSAIFQCISSQSGGARIKKIILTASGGPFFGCSTQDLVGVTPAQALKNPNWSMGQKITIDSATMMNKGLELIEAAWLFDLHPDQIEIVIHRQSILHSAVMFEDNSVIGQMSRPDMRLAIQYAVTHPQRLESDCGELDLAKTGSLTFSSPDNTTFRAPVLCRDALIRGGTAPALLNGANEEAVAAFLSGKIRFPDITDIAQQTVESIKTKNIHKIEDVYEADLAAREQAGKIIFSGR